MMENEIDVANDVDAAANVPVDPQMIDDAAAGAKSIIQMGDTTIEVYHSFTLGDMYLMLLLMILVIVVTLNALIGRR